MDCPTSLKRHLLTQTMLDANIAFLDPDKSHYKKITCGEATKSQ